MTDQQISPETALKILDRLAAEHRQYNSCAGLSASRKAYGEHIVQALEMAHKAIVATKGRHI